MIPALAIRPHEEIELAFDLFVEGFTEEVELSSLEDDVLERIDLLAIYIEKNYKSHSIGSTYHPKFFNLRFGINQSQ